MARLKVLLVTMSVLTLFAICGGCESERHDRDEEWRDRPSQSERERSERDRDKNSESHEERHEERHE
jgi:hypothetical protein